MHYYRAYSLYWNLALWDVNPAFVQCLHAARRFAVSRDAVKALREGAARDLHKNFRICMYAAL